MRADCIVGGAAHVGGGVEVLYVVEVGAFERVDEFGSPFGITFVEIVGDFEESVGGLGHCGEHHYFALAIAYECGYILDSLRRTYGCSAEFQYLHNL